MVWLRSWTDHTSQVYDAIYLRSWCSSKTENRSNQIWRIIFILYSSLVVVVAVVVVVLGHIEAEGDGLARRVVVAVRRKLWSVGRNGRIGRLMILFFFLFSFSTEKRERLAANFVSDVVKLVLDLFGIGSVSKSKNCWKNNFLTFFKI